jgi:epoxide hydrolase-like predicted phosphatase
MIKAFLFDYGGVMTAGGAGFELPERLAANIGVTDDEAWQMLGPVWSDYSRGKITEAELWAYVEKEHGQPILAAQRDIWNKWPDMRPLPEMVELVRRLKAKGYRVGLLSAVIPNTMAEIRSHGGYDAFDFTILSCEVGYSKPDPEIYELAMRKLPGMQPDEVVFLDDQERFLVPAREMGMQTILVRNAAQAIEDAEALLTDD